MTRTPKAMDREKQVMLEEIKLQPEFIRNNVRDNVERLVKSITGVEDVENVYMVGCGDSFYAAEAARLFFMEHTGLHVEAVEAWSSRAPSELPACQFCSNWDFQFGHCYQNHRVCGEST